MAISFPTAIVQVCRKMSFDGVEQYSLRIMRMF